MTADRRPRPRIRAAAGHAPAVAPCDAPARATPAGAVWPWANPAKALHSRHAAGFAFSAHPTRRAVQRSALGAGALMACPAGALAAPSGFETWREAFRARALARGISESTYIRCLSRIEPDMSVFEKLRKQPEFSEQLWQYINRRVSDWRLAAGKAALQKHHALFARIEKDFGVERGTLLALWGVESAYGDPLVQQNHMRPVFPSLAALAWNEPRRRSYWETELLNALRIVDKGWSTPEEMRGSWAGAMGTPNGCRRSGSMSIDYDGDGRVSPFGRPTTRSAPARAISSRRQVSPRRALGLRGARRRRSQGRQPELRAMGGGGRDARGRQPFRARTTRRNVGAGGAGRRSCSARTSTRCAVQPVDELRARHRPSRRPHLGGGPFVQRSRSERALTLARPGVQTRLTKAASTPRHRRPRRQRHHEGGPGLPDQGRPLAPDGYAGLKVLARLRQGCKPV